MIEHLHKAAQFAYRVTAAAMKRKQARLIQGAVARTDLTPQEIWDMMVLEREDAGLNEDQMKALHAQFCQACLDQGKRPPQYEGA